MVADEIRPLGERHAVQPASRRRRRRPAARARPRSTAAAQRDRRRTPRDADCFGEEGPVGRVDGPAELILLPSCVPHRGRHESARAERRPPPSSRRSRRRRRARRGAGSRGGGRFRARRRTDLEQDRAGVVVAAARAAGSGKRRAAGRGSSACVEVRERGLPGRQDQRQQPALLPPGLRGLASSRDGVRRQPGEPGLVVTSTARSLVSATSAASKRVESADRRSFSAVSSVFASVVERGAREPQLGVRALDEPALLRLQRLRASCQTASMRANRGALRRIASPCAARRGAIRSSSPRTNGVACAEASVKKAAATRSSTGPLSSSASRVFSNVGGAGFGDDPVHGLPAARACRSRTPARSARRGSRRTAEGRRAACFG